MKIRRAYTFVELLIAATLVTILAAIAIPNFLEAQIRSVVSRSRAELGILKMSIEAYRLDHRAYPPNAEPGRPGPGDLVRLTTPVAYLATLPNDAFTVAESRGRRHPGLKTEPYRYVNGFQLDPEEGLKPDPYMSSFGGTLAAMVWGYGPSLDRDTRYSDHNYRGSDILEPPTKIELDGTILLTPYDPSNGTVSWGHIYQRLP